MPGAVALQKIDYRKILKEFFSSSRYVAEVHVPAMNFLMINGAGAPDPENNPDYGGAVESLFSVAYTLKFLVRSQSNLDYRVMPLEGLWWADDMSDFINGNKAR